MDEETIVALATPPGRGGIAVIRLSGSRSAEIVGRLVRPFPAGFQPRVSYHGFLHDDNRNIDECLAVLFRAPRSYSGEDMAEISLHASPFIVEEALALACRCGARLALPGEFTYRALRNGKIDLLQAEAVNDLIQADSRAGSLLEFGNLEGKLSRAVAALRDSLLRAAVEVENVIEFAEDQHGRADGPGADLAAAAAGAEALLASSRFSSVLSHGLRVVIAGRVNVGKSSLFNALLLQERSIVSALPGTTRDFIEETLRLDGFAFRLCDAAGIHSPAGDEIEEQGMRRSRDKIVAADAVLFLVDASAPLQEDDRKIYGLLASKPHVLLANKCDLSRPEVVSGIGAAFPAEEIHLVSATNGENLEAATAFLRGLLRGLPGPDEATALNLRQRGLLQDLQEAIARAQSLQAGMPAAPELVAEEIRRGLGLIGELTGAIGAEDILRGIFARFCIGK